jgi:hypothetical protein
VLAAHCAATGCAACGVGSATTIGHACGSGVWQQRSGGAAAHNGTTLVIGAGAGVAHQASLLGIYIAIWPPTLGAGGFAAQALLLLSTLCGAALGVVQQRHGPCWREMSLISCLCSALCWLVADQQSRGGGGTGAGGGGGGGARALLFLLAYSTLSFFVAQTVRAFQQQTRHDAYALTMALNERRAVTILISALLSATDRVELARMLLGSGLAIVASSSGGFVV